MQPGMNVAQVKHLLSYLTYPVVQLMQKLAPSQLEQPGIKTEQFLQTPSVGDGKI
jgi:hypothetical protein